MRGGIPKRRAGTLGDADGAAAGSGDAADDGGGGGTCSDVTLWKYCCAVPHVATQFPLDCCAIAAVARLSASAAPWNPRRHTVAGRMTLKDRSFCRLTG